MYSYLYAQWEIVKARWKLLRDEPDAGYSTEAVLVTALLVALAIAALALLASAVLKKVQSISL